MRFPRLLAAALSLTLAACATAPVPRAADPGLPVLAIDALEERALLLLLADRKTYEPISLNKALDGDADLRRQVALTLGRIGDDRGGPTLELLLADLVPEVRRAAAFALGELGEQGYREGAQSLLGAMLDPDRETGRLAVEALAKLGVTLGTVTTRLEAAAAAGLEDEALPRLLPSLFRFQTAVGEPPDRWVQEWAERGLRAADPELRAMAAYALARRPKAGAATVLRTLLADADPWVRGWVARALGRIGERSDVERLRPLLDDPAPGPTVQALRAVGSLVAAGKAAAPREWQPRLLELLEDPRPGVRLTAIEAAARWLLDDQLGDLLDRYAASGLRRERELALLALAEGEDPRAAVLLLSFAGESDPVLRARAAEAAGLLRSPEVLERLADDGDPGVRRVALETRLAMAVAGDPAAGELARAALRDPDPGVRTAALSWAVDHPVLPGETLYQALVAATRDRIADARLAAVRALRARAEATPVERGAIVNLLEQLARDRDYLVRRRSAAALEALDVEAPAVGAVGIKKPVQVYREVVQRTRAPRWVEIVTERGTLGVELACPEAPLTCLNFLQLAGQGFFDGLSFHRVVPDFVVQAGDPRGDGLGGPGYAIRDEMNPLGYRAGVVGMALSGPDTGGSQFFITLSPQPHLDGGYTAFGRVTSGAEVLDRIVQGDRIVRVVEAAPD